MSERIDETTRPNVAASSCARTFAAARRPESPDLSHGPSSTTPVSSPAPAFSRSTTSFTLSGLAGLDLGDDRLDLFLVSGGKLEHDGRLHRMIDEALPPGHQVPVHVAIKPRGPVFITAALLDPALESLVLDKQLAGLLEDGAEFERLRGRLAAEALDGAFELLERRAGLGPKRLRIEAGLRLRRRLRFGRTAQASHSLRAREGLAFAGAGTGVAHGVLHLLECVDGVGLGSAGSLGIHTIILVLDG